MKRLSSSVDHYLAEGCGRCSLGGTPACKVHRWTEELVVLRSLVLKAGLKEEIKWGVPCYTYEGANVVMVAAFKEYCSFSFLKGALLKDPKKLLESPGEHSQSTRMFRFRDVEEINKLKTTIQGFLKKAIELEKAGAKVVLKKITDYAVPVELSSRFKKNPSLKKAFDALTPGRQRSYLLHIGSAKQAQTREDRVTKCIPAILKGKGFNER